MMEVKVWVDGIQRVVCGATFDTTCQDVVIALAHAMGRTGRFTLIEKWRDNDRPLTPAECPLRVLHKWGEYAAEVRFVLCQADTQQQKQGSRDRLLKKGGDAQVQGLSPHSLKPPQVNGIVGEASVKRSLTFSGSHNQLADDSAWLSSSAPTSKFRKTHLGPVPNGDVNQLSGIVQAPQQHHTQPAARLGTGDVAHQARAPSASVRQPQHPVVAPHHHNVPQAVGDRTAPSVPTPSSLPLSHAHLSTNTKRVSAFQPLQASRSRVTGPSSEASTPKPSQSQAQPPQSSSHPHAQPHPEPQSHSLPQAHQAGFRPPGSRVQPAADAHQPPSGTAQHQGQRTHLHPEQYSDENPYVNTPNPPSPPLPASPPPPTSSLHKNAVSQNQKSLATEQTPAVSSDSSTLAIEEYDLDHTFAEPHRDLNHNKRAGISQEYRLEDGLGSVSGSRPGGQLEGEHAKLMRLVNMQQQRLKTQESQISLVNTEISALEEKEEEYEENLHIIMEELLLQENRQLDLEPQLNDLEQVEWENVLDGEKKCEEDLMQKIASCKAMLLEQDRKLDSVKHKENELLQDLRVEDENIAQERERLKEVEVRAREEERTTREDILSLQTEFSQLQRTSEDCEASLADVSSELNSVERSLEEKDEQLKDLETDLKAENLKGLEASTLPKQDRSRPIEGGEALMKILEKRLSPHPMDTSSFPFTAALATANQSGLWV